MNRVLQIAAMGEAVTGVALLVSPPLVARLVFGASVEGVGIIACRLAGLALIGLGIACWPGVSGNPAKLGMLVYGLAAAVFLAGLGIGGMWGDASGALLWPAVAAHAVITVLLMRAWFRRPRLG